MSKNKWKDKEEAQDKTKLSDENPLIPRANSLNLSDKKEEKVEYFLGYKRKNFNQLWDWNTLKDVSF